MNDNNQERTVFEEGDVKITDVRVMFDTQTYAMKTYNISSITSVSVSRQEPGSCLSFILIVGGLISLFPSVQISAIIFNSLDMGVGWVLLVLIGNIVAIALGFRLRKLAKPSFAIRVQDISGVTVAYSSQDEAFVSRVVNVLNESITRKY